MSNSLTINKLPKVNILVIKQSEGARFFITTKNSIVISVSTLAFILSFLIKNGYMSEKILEGILEEFKE